MMATGFGDTLPAVVGQSADTHPLIDALRLQGAEQFDPVRLHYIEALAQRASAHQGNVKCILDGKLEAAAAALRERMERVQAEAPRTALASAAAPHRETLGDLVRHMAQHSPEKVDHPINAATTSRTELKSVRYFRNTWSKLSAEKQVNRALGRAPKNAGPINSHVVALRSLALMREASPDYLNRFMSYVDTLLRLEQGDQGAPPLVKPSRAAKAVKK
ncbi:MAG: DUF2894 domain-containing protein [Burkholderiaceae bacterium]|nr:DUF2894 domain-containing protein [Burkholderiaceae bacterium]